MVGVQTIFPPDLAPESGQISPLPTGDRWEIQRRTLPLLWVNQLPGKESGQEELPEQERQGRPWSETTASSASSTHCPSRKHRRFLVGPA